MSRSLKKGPFVDAKLAKKVAALKVDDRTVIKTWARAVLLHQIWSDSRFAVHNGRVHVPVLSRKTWLVTNSVSLAQPVSSASTVERIRSNG
jgi:ribosomal protein S19